MFEVIGHDPDQPSDPVVRALRTHVISRAQGTAIIALFVAVLVVIGLSFALGHGDATPPRYEYQVRQILDSDLQPDLRVLGEKGWRLVTARWTATEDPNAPSRRAGVYECIFMRRARTPALDLP
jgi:hypothetical protein